MTKALVIAAVYIVVSINAYSQFDSLSNLTNLASFGLKYSFENVRDIIDLKIPKETHKKIMRSEYKSDLFDARLINYTGSYFLDYGDCTYSFIYANGNLVTSTVSFKFVSGQEFEFKTTLNKVLADANKSKELTYSNQTEKLTVASVTNYIDNVYSKGYTVNAVIGNASYLSCRTPGTKYGDDSCNAARILISAEIKNKAYFIYITVAMESQLSTILKIDQSQMNYKLIKSQAVN